MENDLMLWKMRSWKFISNSIPIFGGSYNFSCYMNIKTMLALVYQCIIEFSGEKFILKV
jgi:hypothetical protein